MTRNERNPVVIAGGGIGGLAAALACARQRVPVQLLERATQLSEVGAGIQLGPNVTRILQAWGLGAALAQVAAFPKQLQARDAQGIARASEPYQAHHRARLGAAHTRRRAPPSSQQSSARRVRRPPR